MQKQQTFLFCIEGYSKQWGKITTLDFWRHSDKKLETVLKKHIEFYNKNYTTSYVVEPLFVKDSKVIVYKTDYETSPERIVFEMSADEFISYCGLDKQTIIDYHAKWGRDIAAA